MMNLKFVKKNSLNIGNSKFKNPKCSLVRTIVRKIQKKVLKLLLQFVGGVAFWKFRSHVKGNETLLKLQFSKFQKYKANFVKTNEKIFQEKFDKFWL